jgi:hypothetical protein
LSLRYRIGLIALFFAVAAGLIVYGSMAYLRQDPPNVDLTQGHAAGQPVHLAVQTMGAWGHGQHPTWVTYMVRDRNGHWVHSTLWQLPAHTRIDVTIYQYDSGSPLRNQYLGGVTGVGGTYRLNGKPITVLNSNDGGGVGHTFTVPALGINIPLWGISPNSKNACSAGPCLTSMTHNTITFSFTTPGPGQYRWQCFVPCGLSYLDGNGGPMQTIGYMAGFIKVLS